MDSKLLVGLIKEVVKNEVKQQVKEELAKLMQQTPKQIPSTGNAGLDAIQKALNRDYTQLTKVFTKQEKEKGLR